MSFDGGELDSSPIKSTFSPATEILNSSTDCESEEFRVESSPFLRTASSNLQSSPLQLSDNDIWEQDLTRKRRRLFSSSFDEDTVELSSLPQTGNPQESFRRSPSQHGDYGDIDQNENSDSDDSYYPSQQDPENLNEDDNVSKSSSIDILAISESESESDIIDICGDEINIPECELLFDNSPATVEEAVLGLCDVYIKNRLTKTALSDMIKYTKSILPEDNAMPNNLGEFFNFIKARAPPVEEIPHLYCSGCLVLKAKKDDRCLTEGCDAIGGNYFYEFPLAKQIKFMLEERDLASAVEEFQRSRVAESEMIRDIGDGSVIKTLKKVYNGQYDLTILWNTDGISLGDSSYHLWPVLYTFCEIRPPLRALNINVSMIWYEKREPPMAMFLQPFVKSLKKIKEEGGIPWTHPKTGEKIVSQVTAPVAVADAPARADLQNIKRFNGINGCNNCEITCRIVLVKGKNRYYYVFAEGDAKLRSGVRMIKQAELATTVKNGSVKGVKGISPVCLIPHLDVGKFVFPEYMHSVLLGVVSSFTLLMINFDGPWRLKKNLKNIDKLMLSITVPDFMKIPQPLSLIKKYKAHELRAWLLFFSLIILSDFLPENYFQHWMLLVRSVYLLLQEKISENDLQSAEIMLRMFVRDVGTLYTKTAYKYNTHQLLHLVLTVRRWGPLWANSAFIFENYNGVISRMIHGTKHKAKELAENLKISSGIMALRSAVTGSVVLRTDVVGKEVDFTFSETDQSKISEINCQPFKVYLRAKVGKTVFTCQQYDNGKRRCNSFAIVNDDGEEKVAQIVCYLKCLTSQDIWCLVDIFCIDHVRFFVHKASRLQVNHIIPIKETARERAFLPIVNLKEKVIKVQNYVCVCPNSIEVNL